MLADQNRLYKTKKAFNNHSLTNQLKDAQKNYLMVKYFTYIKNRMINLKILINKENITKEEKNSSSLSKMDYVEMHMVEKMMFKV